MRLAALQPPVECDEGVSGAELDEIKVGRAMSKYLVMFCALMLASAASAQSVVDVRVTAGSDDAEERQSGSVKLTSSDLELVDDGSKRPDQTIGIRVNGIAIPLGATIDKAYIQFTVDNTDSGPTSVTVYGQAAGNPPTFSSASFDVTSRSKTAASVDWQDIPPWDVSGVAGTDQQTPDLSAIVQEIIDGPGWASGNSIVFIIEGSGERTAEAFDGTAAQAPLLHVEFNGGGGGGPTNQAPSQFDAFPAVMENSPDGVVVAVFDNVVDPDVGDFHVIQMVDGANGRFDVVGNTLVVLDGSRLDFETAAQHTVIIEACDDGVPVLCVEKSITIALIDDTTEPPPPPVTSVTFGNIGDYGKDNASNITIAGVLRDNGAEWITTNGDNRYGNITMESAVGLAYGDYVAAGEFFPSIGNRDYSDGGGIGEYLAYFDLPGNELYYSVVRGPVEMFFINGESEEPDGGGSYSSVQGAWLAAATAASTASWQMVFMHRPSLTNEWPFESLGIDAVFAGHDHTYERTLRDENGDGIVIPYFVNGVGFASDGGGMIVRVDENSATFEFWSIDGVLIDTVLVTQ